MKWGADTWGSIWCSEPENLSSGIPQDFVGGDADGQVVGHVLRQFFGFDLEFVGLGSSRLPIRPDPLLLLLLRRLHPLLPRLLLLCLPLLVLVRRLEGVPDVLEGIPEVVVTLL